jgi:large-conductance mechanosensitive channel
MLTWEGKTFAGVGNIVEHLTVSLVVPCRTLLTPVQELPFEKVKHRISTCDAQPSSLDMSTLLISVTGFLIVRFFFFTNRATAADNDLGG